MSTIEANGHRLTPEEVIRRKRRSLGVTQDELAELSNVSRSAIGSVEVGRYKYNEPTLQALNKALDEVAASRGWEEKLPGSLWLSAPELKVMIIALQLTNNLSPAVVAEIDVPFLMAKLTEAKANSR